MKTTKYYFVGIGGTGMASLAFLMKEQQCEIWGSDRAFDRGETSDRRKELEAHSIQIVPQDGSFPDVSFDAAVYSTAVEPDNPDLVAAQRHGVPLVSRAGLLADVFNRKRGVAVGGTSGKSTVVGMLAHILRSAGEDYTLVTGARIKELGPGGIAVNFRSGRGRMMLIEADESDGSVTLYRPAISVITNISRDHKEIPELVRLFKSFCDATTGTVITNAECPISETLLRSVSRPAHAVFSLSSIENVSLNLDASRFSYERQEFSLKAPGLHNIANALAAMRAAAVLGIPSRHIRAGIEAFRGLERRLEAVGAAGGVHVYDDYAHNPAKMEASITSLQPFFDGVIAVYQPHGYGPLKLHREDLGEVAARVLRPADSLYILPVYDAGGTADRSISSQEVAAFLKSRGVAAHFVARTELLAMLPRLAKPGDCILVMGARDNTLGTYARQMLEKINSKD